MKKKISLLTIELVMIVITILFIIPIWMVLVNSFKTNIELINFSLALPKHLLIENYIRVFTQGNGLKALTNGVILSTTSVAIGVILSSMAAFYIARTKKRFALIMYSTFVIGLIVPGATIPTYLILKILHMTNTYHGLILVYATGALSFNIFLYTGFIKTVPKGLDEAAAMDGCKGYRLFFTIIFPLLKPTTATIVIFNFLGVWNDVSTQLYFASPDMWTMPMTVYSFFGRLYNEWNVIFADIIVTLIPLIVLYGACQKYIVSGMTAGAIKS